MELFKRGLKRIGTKAFAYEMGMMLLGSLLSAAAINLFFLPANLTMGGMSGFASILHLLPGLSIIPFGVFIILLNIPVFMLGAFKVSRRFLVSSLIGTVVYSIMIDLTKHPITLFYQHYMQQLEHGPDLFLAAVLGGALYGFGLGMMLRVGYNTGGTDIIAILFRLKTKKISLGQIIWIMDALIIMGAVFAYRGDENGSVTLALYSALSMYMTSKTIDFWMEGFDFKRTAFIISRHPDEITQRVMKELDRGVTALQGQGGYTGREQKVLVTVLEAQQIPQLNEIVQHCDEHAFVFVMDTREVRGEGFERKAFG